ncbi:MAG: TonB-dependent receptor [Gammaproteobacteria bacterium]|nr:TonB-dependent receptor [Gammaproteobacteria bacterium]MBU1489364.1 TonB-dependent receptor [Gammaproteobacteria bacterium]MBU2065243.1 TonB-dependent receptor [Gammaproteobacteria bacterium]MBU2141124.1 TonB-dependent receptor [Gammaproteobacteria bacterium]MBU2215347.1 TonB-dependent receptor [Gammaproteobacteria bacterium]
MVQADSEIDFNLPAAPLEKSLNALASQSDLQILFSSDIATGKATPALRGRYTAAEALNILLGSSGLKVQQQDEHTYIVVPEERATPMPRTASAATIELAPVMVSGEKISRTLAQTQSSVVVETADSMRAHGDKDIGSVFSRTPGVYTQAGNENWGIRGVPVSGFDDQGPATLNGAVSVYVDGAQQPNRALTLSPMSMWDVEQVEVLLGPQSTTQGRNSLAGAVVIETRNPTFEPTFSAQTNAGNYGESGAAVAGGGALIDGVVAGRVAVDYQDGDGYIDNITTGSDANPNRNKNARGKLLILPNDDLDVLLTYAHHNSQQGDNSILRSNNDVQYYKVASNTEASDKLQQNTGTAKVDYRLSEAFTLTSLTSGTQSDYQSRLDFDQTATRNQEVVRTQETHLFSQELRLAYEGDTLRGFAGAYYGRTSNAYHDRLSNNGNLLGTVKGYTRIHNRAVFGELNWTFVPDWTLITGLRYDNEQNDTDVEQDDFSNPGQVSKTFNALLPKLGLDYQFAADQYLGFVVQKGYRGGGVNVRAGSSHADYDPEYTTNYELSYRGSWLDDSLRARANLYYTDWKDQQVSMLDSTGNFFEVYNAASSTIRGLELFVERDLTSRLQVNAGLAFTDGRYGDFAYGDDADLSGESFLYAPKYKVSVGSSYRFANGLKVTSDVVYQDGSPSQYEFDASGDVIHTRRSDDFVLVNLNAEYELIKGWAVSGYVKNLFDKEYVTNNRGGDIIDVGAPRTVGLVLHYDL